MKGMLRDINAANSLSLPDIMIATEMINAKTQAIFTKIPSDGREDVKAFTWTKLRAESNASIMKTQ
jgi:hypothetical protein